MTTRHIRDSSHRVASDWLDKADAYAWAAREDDKHPGAYYVDLSEEVKA